ncbi:MAG: Hpt domain-containing protein [Planctomycetota bacterium]
MPIIAFTRMPYGTDRCLQAGMDAYVIKPIDDEQLFTVMESMLSGRSEDKEDSKVMPPRITTMPRPLPRYSIGKNCFGRRGQAAVVAEITQLFLEQSLELMSSMRAALESRDQEHLRQSLHTLAGSVGNSCPANVAGHLPVAGRRDRKTGRERKRRLRNWRWNYALRDALLSIGR